MPNLPQTITFLPLPVAIHLVAALVSVVLGAWQLLAQRIGHRHRGVGYVWIAAMAVTALSSFWLKSPLGRDWLDGFSFIHGLSLCTLVSLVIAVNLARQRKIEAHRRWMQTTFISLIVAGLLAAASPGRVLNNLLFTTAPQYLTSLAR